jgi:hypothetical protein
MPACCARTDEYIPTWLDDANRTPAALHAVAARAECLACRASLDSAAVLASAVRTFMPSGRIDAALTDDIVHTLLADRQHLRRRAFAGAVVAVAASVLVAGWALTRGRPATAPDPLLPRSGEVAVVTPPAPETTLAEATSALRSLGQKAADGTLTASSVLIPSDRLALPAGRWSPDVSRAAEALSATSGAAKAGLEPVANSAYRAVSYFIRDLGAGPDPKPKS